MSDARAQSDQAPAAEPTTPTSPADKAESEKRKAARKANEAITTAVSDALQAKHLDGPAIMTIVESVAKTHGVPLPSAFGFDAAGCTVADCELLSSTMYQAGKYDEMVAWLYANQGTTPAAVRDAAVRILGVKDFDKEYALKLPEIRRDIADGGVLRINSTPTFFINGVRIPDGVIPPDYFELAINLELKRVG